MLTNLFVFVLAAFAAAAGLAGWGTGWFLLFWLPLVSLLLLPALLAAWRSRVTRKYNKPLPVYGEDGSWELRIDGQQGQTPLPLIPKGRAYVTSTLIAAVFADSRQRLHHFAITAGALDPVRHRQLRIALRLDSARRG